MRIEFMKRIYVYMRPKQEAKNNMCLKANVDKKRMPSGILFIASVKTYAAFFPNNQENQPFFSVVASTACSALFASSTCSVAASFTPSTVS